VAAGQAVVGVLTIAGLVGTVTILIGAFIVPAGALLFAACLSLRPQRPASRGWYADPWGHAQFRWWDGKDWTGHTLP
jgi:hypothetical protein